MAFRVWIFLHSLRRLLLLDNRALRHRRGMDGGCPASARKHRRTRGRAGDFFHPDPAFARTSLPMDEHPAWKRSEPRFQARLFESEFLRPARRLFPRLLHYRVAITPP